MVNDILNIIVDPDGKTVTYNLSGDRTINPRLVLTKVFSAYDSPDVLQAIDTLVSYYENVVKGGEI